MVTQNVINGFVIPDDIAEIRDFPREFKISTVDFVYQRIAFLIECFPLRKEIIELAQSDNDCQKMKRKIKPNTALSWLNRLIKKGLLINTDDKGVYTRTHVDRKSVV